MENFTKIINPGITKDCGRLWVKINFKDDKLSITGVEGPKPNGDARGSRGQIIMHEWKLEEYSEGWDAKMVETLRAFWEQWHLNDMTAGSPAQETYLKDNEPALPEYPRTPYDARLEALRSVGLETDASYMHNGKPYRYGSAWLFRGVPEDVLQWLHDLPEPSLKPAWV